MTALLILALLFLASVAALLRTIAGDGLGHRPGPRSHIDPFDPRNAFS